MKKLLGWLRNRVQFFRDLVATDRYLEFLLGEFLDFLLSMSVRKWIFAVLSMILLGTSVTLIYHTNLGMSAWDAVTVNLVNNTSMEFRHANPLIALVLMTIVHIIQKKVPSLMFFFPLFVSFLIGVVIDKESEFLPSVASLSIVFNLLYLLIASILVGFGLNLMIYIQFPLPAIDQFCHTMAKTFHLTFGQGKYLGEITAILGSIGLGLIYHTQSEYFYLGFTTIYYALALGFVIDLIRNPFYRFLGIQTFQLYADNLLEEDINHEHIVQASRAIILNKGKLLILHYKEEDFYLLPGGTREKRERLEHCLKREIMEETGLKIKVKEEHLIIKEYHPDITFENHYFMTKLSSDKVYTKKIAQTEQEKQAEIEIKWIDVKDVLSLFASHDTDSGKGMHLMEREFIALSSIL